MPLLRIARKAADSSSAGFWPALLLTHIAQSSRVASGNIAGRIFNVLDELCGMGQSLGHDQPGEVRPPHPLSCEAFAVL
jgi:hypothetical protein